jgi:hypothetical protein
MKRGKKVVKVLMITLVVIAVAFGFVMVTMYLWNWLVPSLFGGPVITFWQALGLLVLSKILFSGFGKGGHRHGGGSWKQQYWKSHLKEKWSTMTPEDRERLKEKIRGKWCMPREEQSVSKVDNPPQ